MGGWITQINSLVQTRRGWGRYTAVPWLTPLLTVSTVNKKSTEYVISRKDFGGKF